MNTKRPSGKIPNDTRDWVLVNEKECWWEVAVCDCGRWYESMDHLAPYHWEMCRCRKCGTVMDQRKKT